ncbi:MAG TPA: tetratricopeptide repeat protein [Burkholderiales bacterium]|nr:tetratricopeptide repeat protein [Burkholderiales bacterium]
MLNRLFARIGRERADARACAVAAASRESPFPEHTAATPESVATLASVGDYAQALALIDVALARAPNDPEWVFARGNTLFEWARFREARPWLLKAAEFGIDDPRLLLRAGWASLWTTGGESGEPWMRKLTQRVPDDWLGQFGLGSSLRAQGRIDEAVACFERALERSPGNENCLSHLFECRYVQGRLPEAESFAKRALDAEPANPRTWTTLGIALVAQDRFREATDAFERAEAIDASGGDIDPHLNLAICLRETGRLPEALALYERELVRRPSIAAQAHYGHALLTAGRLAEGWLHYEFRWMQDPLLSLRPSFGRPLWSGQDLRGKTILLRCEQGVGDVIQFIRYAPDVKALGATVLLQLRKNIRELAESFPGVDRIVDVGEAIPDFDYYLHLMSLPRLFATDDVHSIPADVPYLRAEQSRIERWASRLRTEALKVGLVWGGDPAHLRDRYRSIPLGELAPLWAVEGVRFFSLQKGPQAAQIAAAPDGSSLVDLGADLHDFADTAAVVSLLDVLICADTSVAHLAGALGKPVWTLVPTPSDWRWLEGREDSPWYPTMRLFRQARQGDWGDVIGRVTQDLQGEAARHRRLAASSPTIQVAAPRASLGAPSDAPSRWLAKALTSVAETRVGIIQYWPDHDPVGRSIERYGEYLQPQLDAIARWIAPGATIVEAGAGIGLHALYLASAIGPAGHLLLYEDDAIIRQVLRQNLQANRMGNVTVMKRRLRRVSDDLVKDAGAAASDEAGLETIDDLRLEALQWLKVNDAAAAMAILAGAADTLWRLRPRLWLVAPEAQALHELGATTKDFGYRCFRLETPLFNPSNFNRRSVDVFEGCTVSALLAIPEEAGIDVALDCCVEA